MTQNLLQFCGGLFFNLKIDIFANKEVDEVNVYIFLCSGVAFWVITGPNFANIPKIRPKLYRIYAKKKVKKLKNSLVFH